MPNRIIKESICTSDSIDKLSWFEEVLFYRLIVNCDDYGRFDGRPAIIKNRLFPLKESLTTKAVSEAVKTLASAGMVTLYEFEGKPYLYLPTWNDHQSVRAKRSKYPQPESTGKPSESNCNHLLANDCKCPRNPIQSESNPNPIREAGALSACAREENADDPELARVISLFLNKINPLPSDTCIEELEARTKEMGAEVVCCAIETANDENIRSWKYIQTILQAYHTDGVKTIEDVKRREAARQAQKEGSRRPRPNQVVAGTIPDTKPIDMDALQKICDSM